MKENKIMETKHISDLQVGDKVFIQSRYGQSLDEVARITKTQVILKSSESKFRISSGTVIGGDSWSTSRISHATDEEIQKFKQKIYRRKLIEAIKQEDLKDRSIEDLEKICEILNIPTK